MGRHLFLRKSAHSLIGILLMTPIIIFCEIASHLLFKYHITEATIIFIYTLLYNTACDN